MIDSLYIGATGMHAQQMNVDVVANNLANINTAGFKRNRIDFEDLLYRSVQTGHGDSISTAPAARFGLGAAVAGTNKIFVAGDNKKTDGALDLAIRGNGFFEVSMPDGSYGYTRNGAFRVNEEGMLVNQDGFALSAQIQIPSDATDIKIGPDGRVFAKVAGESTPAQLGTIELATFVNTTGLEASGNSLYMPTQASGEALRGFAGENGMGTLAQGYLEGSNVQLVDEMINLVIAQRAYEINSKVVQASDEMLSITNSLMR